MGLKGSAFLGIWHDIAVDAHDDYREWHTREHMPERLSIPGFRTGKRLHRPDADRYVYGTIYAGDDVEVFRSPAYLERLNNPTPWTQKVSPTFQNFLRVACDRVASAGVGDGGTMATWRFDYAASDAEARLRADGQALVDKILAVPGICGVHLGLARSEISSVRTRETELRHPMSETGFDAVLLVEGSARPALEAAMADAERLAVDTGLLTAPRGLVYETAYTLTSDDMAATR